MLSAHVMSCIVLYQTFACWLPRECGQSVSARLGSPSGSYVGCYPAPPQAADCDLALSPPASLQLRPWLRPQLPLSPNTLHIHGMNNAKLLMQLSPFCWSAIDALNDNSTNTLISNCYARALQTLQVLSLICRM